jgi:hypothetical protein
MNDTGKNTKQLNEASLGRVWQHYKSDRPIATLTAFRGEYTYEENVRRNKQLAAEVRELGYGFFFLDGAWIENEWTPQEKHVSEDSLFIIGDEKDDKRFRNEMIHLAKKYNQEGVLIKDSERVAVYDSSGNISFELSNLQPGMMGDVYSRLRTNKELPNKRLQPVSRSFKFESERDDLGWLGRLAGIRQ